MSRYIRCCVNLCFFVQNLVVIGLWGYYEPCAPPTIG